MNRTAAKILSVFFFGVFTAPIVSIIWFQVPALRDFPVGDDSPHGVGLPVGFIIGGTIAFLLNRIFDWGRAGKITGAVFLLLVLIGSAFTIFKMSTVQGWNGIGWLLGFLLCLHGLVSAVGLLLSGFFAQRTKDRSPLPK